MRYAVVGCQCGNAWSVELRHHTTTCQKCRKSLNLRKRRRIWQGDDMQAAQKAAAELRTALAQGVPESQAHAVLATLEPPAATPRHDSPIDAAASKALGIVNKSARAEAVALWSTRLLGPTAEDELMEGMTKAGLEPARAEKEIVRMLAMDILYEPTVGHYATLET